VSDSINSPTSSQSDGPPRTAGRRVGLAGLLIGVIGLGFAFFALYKAWDELVAADLSPGSLIAAAVIGLLGMATIGLNWIRILRILGSTPRLVNGFRWYFVGQLGKYIPGGLWAVLGRAELATRGGIQRPVAYSSVGVNLITTYAAAASTGAVFIGLGSTDTSTGMMWIVVSMAIVTAAVVAVSRPVVDWISSFAGRLGRQVELPSASISTSLSAIILTMPAWLAIGGATALVAHALGFSAGVPQIIAATCYAWLAGFLVVPLPSGLGVREAVFITLYPGPTQEAAATAVIARVVFILVDLTGAGVASLVSQLDRQRTP
jgi:uncharacterized membrane protein YbhN (UPF0104 family)